MSEFDTLADSMEIILTKRRSVRAYKENAIAQPLLENIFTLAQKSPSNCNTQPWIVHVASGETLNAMREALPEQVKQGKTHLDFT